MDATSPTQDNNQITKSSSPTQSTSAQNHELGSEHGQSGCMEIRTEGTKFIDIKQLEPPPKDAPKNSSRLGRKESKFSSMLRKKNYMLRSSVGSARVLRSKSCETSKASVPSRNSTNISAKREKQGKKKKKVKRTLNDEFSRTRKRVRYILTRMGYEQSLIDAYSGEGWKGQSLEKIKPEKELQRATSEILHCKLKIRDLFQRLDSLCAEGRLQESLFDSEGLIYSEDIFCAKCGSKDLSTDNDILLCDGACNRGFHQMCLEPPLSKEEIPPGDEGWLCPGCDCKADCIDLLNDYQGTNLYIDDNWEKVFPEAAATASGAKLDDYLGLPSDDSEDNDYDPDGPEIDEKVQTEGSSSEESDFISASDDSGASPHNEQYVGLPSDDSEDDDYNPNAPDLDELVKQESSTSDFTSDSEDFSALSGDNRSSGTDVLVISSPDGVKLLTGSDDRTSTMVRKRKHSVNSELQSLLDSDLSLENAAVISSKRQRERLDYKKLHDETYGNVPSDSSDDEEWTDDAPRKMEDGIMSETATQTTKTRTIDEGINQNLKEAENTPKGRPRQKLESLSAAKTHKDRPEPSSTVKRASTSGPRSLGKSVTERLCTVLKENSYPDRATKENLAEELGITLRQVGKWFENARRSLRVSANVGTSRGETTPNKNTDLIHRNGKVLEPGPKTTADDAASNCNQGGDEVLINAGTTTKVSVMECSSEDAERRESEVQENNKHALTPSNSRKRKGKSDDETLDDALDSKEMPMKVTPVDSPKSQSAGKNGRNANQEATPTGIQTRSRKAVI